MNKQFAIIGWAMVAIVILYIAVVSKTVRIVERERVQAIVFGEWFSRVKQLEKIYKQHTSLKIAHQVAVLTIEYSDKKYLPPLLVASIIIEESGVKPWAKGLAGEVSFMQIYPKFWRGVFPECGKNLWKARTNICYGTSILNWSVAKSDSDFVESLHGYNGRVNQPTLDTKLYSQRVLARLGRLYLNTYKILPDSLKEN